MVNNIDIKIDEGMPVKDIQISIVESNIEDTTEEEEEQVQESEKEDSKSDNEGTDSQQQLEKPSSRIIRKKIILKFRLLVTRMKVYRQEESYSRIQNSLTLLFYL